MTPGSTVTLLACATLGLMLQPATATAAGAMHKCVVNGRTTYQQHACGADAENAPGAAARTDPDTRKGSPDARLVPLARDAFADLRAGRLQAYAARLCKAARTGASGAASGASLEDAAADYARRRLALGAVVERTGRAVIFSATETEAASRPVARSLRISASFDWEAGVPCLVGVEATRNPG